MKDNKNLKLVLYIVGGSIALYVALILLVNITEMATVLTQGILGLLMKALKVMAVAGIIGGTGYGIYLLSKKNSNK